MCSSFDILHSDRLNDLCAHHFEQHVEKLARDLRVMRAGLAARSWFHRHGPAWAPPLPLCECEFEKCFCSGYFGLHLVAWYSESLWGRDFDYLGHPGFVDYARGVLAVSLAGC
jgi:hypothetical protein